MRRKRRRVTARRNLLLLGGLVSLLALLAVGVRVINTAPPVILPDGRDEIAAHRTSPENGYTVLKEAESLIGKIPGPLILKSEENPARQQFFEPELDSVARFLNMRRPDDDPDFLAYLHGSRPACDKAREALAKPFFYLPEASTYLYRAPSSGTASQRIVLQMVALGATLGRVEGALDEGLPYLCDAIRLARRMSQDGNAYYLLQAIEMPALKQVRLIARGGLTPPQLETVQEALAALGPPFADRKQLLEEAWRTLDNTLLLPVRQRSRDPGENFFTRFLLWRLRRVSRGIIANKALWYESIELSPYEAERWMEAHSDIAGDMSQWFAPIHEVRRLLEQAARIQAEYWATVLAVALERYHSEHGEYPETLEALAGLLSAIPHDPFTNMPLVYHRQDSGYLLYSVGLNGEDEGGYSQRRGGFGDRLARPRWGQSRQQDDIILLSPLRP